MRLLRVLTVIGVLIILIITNVQTNADPTQRQCEPIRIELCRGIGYNETSMPNIMGHELQTEADFTLHTFSPLIQYGCSAQLHFFLCAAYVPMCTAKVEKPIGPCRGLCETVRARCHPVLQGFGFPWPTALDCNRFPKENNQEHMCMEGHGEPTGGGAKETMSSKTPNYEPTCSGLIKSHLYVRLNRSGRCAPLCEADIMFAPNEKDRAEVWVTSWSCAALFTAVVGTLCLVLSDTRWDKVLLPLVICHCLVTVGWTVRWLAGRNATACAYDAQLPGVSLLAGGGGTLSTAPCAATFLLRYYFGMAAAVWWAILCYKWNASVRRVLSETLGDAAAEKTDDSYSTLIQLTAWGLPTLLTVSVLVARLVDADELLGACYIGNQSDRALLTFGALPLLTFWMIGSGYLFTAYLRRRSAAPALANNLPVNLKGMGTFLFIYCIPSGLLLVLLIYEYASRETWLNLPQPSQKPEAPIKAPVWTFILRAFTELLIGVLASAWAVGPRIAGLCKNKLNPVYKAKQPMPITIQPQTKYTPSAYSTASYQTVCPQNVIVSVPIAKMSRHTTRKYPSHSHINRKPRTYRTSSQTMSLTGNETVL